MKNCQNDPKTFSTWETENFKWNVSQSDEILQNSDEQFTNYEKFYCDKLS